MRTTPSYDKDPWRGQNVRFVLGTQRLVSAGRVVCSVMEMFGLSGTDSFRAWRPHLRSARQFLGVENDPATIALAWAALAAVDPAERPALALADAYSAAARAAGSWSPPVGVFVFDTSGAAGAAAMSALRGDLSREAVRLAVARYGSAVVILNHALDRGPGTPSQRLAAHSEAVVGAFGEWGLSPARLMGKLDAAAADDRVHEGAVGAFDVYRSASIASDDARHRRMRMATLRMRFWDGGVTMGRDG
jgi:hypothetical protein